MELKEIGIIKKPLNLLPPIKIGEKSHQKYQTEFEEGKRFFSHLMLLNSSEKNKYNLLYYLGNLHPEDSPYDFEHFLLSRNPFYFQEQRYLIGFDNRGRLYFITPNELIRDFFRTR